MTHLYLLQISHSPLFIYLYLTDYIHTFIGSFDSPDNFNYPAAVGNALDAGVAVTFYYGKCDTACPYVGGTCPYVDKLCFVLID